MRKDDVEMAARESARERKIREDGEPGTGGSRARSVRWGRGGSGPGSSVNRRAGRNHPTISRDGFHPSARDYGPAGPWRITRAGPSGFKESVAICYNVRIEVSFIIAQERRA